MQQRLAVVSVVVLALLAGATAFMVQSHAYGQAQPKVTVLSQNTQAAFTTSTTNTNSTSTSTTSVTTSTNSTSTGMSLLTTATTTYNGDE